VIRVVEHGDDLAGDVLAAVAALDAEPRLVVTRAVQTVVTRVEPVGRQTLAAFCDTYGNRRHQTPPPAGPLLLPGESV